MSINRRTVYGKIVPAIAILLGLSYAFIDNEAVHRVLLIALAAAAALGWLAPAGGSEELASRRERREARHDLRAQRNASDGTPAQIPSAESGQPGPVLDGVPQDAVRRDEHPR